LLNIETSRVVIVGRDHDPVFAQGVSLIAFASFDARNFFASFARNSARWLRSQGAGSFDHQHQRCDWHFARRGISSL